MEKPIKKNHGNKHRADDSNHSNPITEGVAMEGGYHPPWPRHRCDPGDEWDDRLGLYFHIFLIGFIIKSNFFKLRILTRVRVPLEFFFQSERIKKKSDIEGSRNYSELPSFLPRASLELPRTPPPRSSKGVEKERFGSHLGCVWDPSELQRARLGCVWGPSGLQRARSRCVWCRPPPPPPPPPPPLPPPPPPPPPPSRLYLKTPDQPPCAATSTDSVRMYNDL